MLVVNYGRSPLEFGQNRRYEDPKISGTGARFSKAPERFQARKANFKSPWVKNRKILRFETLHKCKLCLNVKPVEIKSSAHQALHGF